MPGKNEKTVGRHFLPGSVLPAATAPLGPGGRSYPGRVLGGKFSPALVRRVVDCIRRMQAMEDIPSPAILYVAAWRRADRVIWYEYASPRLLELLQVKVQELPLFFKNSIEDRRVYRTPGDLPEIHTHEELETQRPDLRREARDSGGLAAVYKLALPGGRRVWLKDQARVETWEPDGVSLSVGCLTEVTREMEAEEARRLAEEKLLQARKLEAAGQLAGGIAHDFNNLLAVILGNLELADMETPRKSPAAGRLAEAQAAVEKARELTRRFITFSGGGAPRLSRVDLLPILETCLARLQEDRMGMALSGCTVKGSLSPAPGLPGVLADPDQIAQVFSNLLENARDAMPLGGTVQVSAEPLRVTSALDPFLPYLPPGGYVRVAVQDQGHGIPEKDLPRVFDPYFTTRERGQEKGLGLGLSVAWSIVRKHNGHIRLESGPGKGTTALVVLPAAND